MTWIAEQKVTWVLASGERRPGRIAIGLPIVVSEVEASCWYALDGLEYVAGPMLGSDTMQALCLALRFVGWKLHTFVERGGRVMDVDGEEEAGLEAVFGPLLADRLVAEPPTSDDEPDEL